jgi:hypothetical protein
LWIVAGVGRYHYGLFRSFALVVVEVPAPSMRHRQKSERFSVSCTKRNTKTLDTGALLYYSKDLANVLAPEKQIAIIGSLCEGSSIRAIERMTGVHQDTVMRLGVRLARAARP